MSSISKTNKIKYLHTRYKYLSLIINNLNKHIENLCNHFIITNSLKNKYFHFLFDILRELNDEYNNYILKQLGKNDNIDKLFNYFDNEYIDNIVIFIDNNNNPLFYIEQKLINFIENNGYISIIELVNIQKNISFSNDTFILLNEINDIFLPTSLSIQKNMNYNYDYYWIIPKNFNENDKLELVRELYLYNNKINQYIKITGFFKNDNINYYIRTAQINYSIFDNKRNEILKNCDTTINKNFLYNIIKYDYIGNIYTMNIENYLKHIDILYSKFVQIINSNLISIVKYFTNKDTNIKNMYITLLLLLIGDDNTINIASILFSLLKNKKNNSIIYNLFTNKFPYYLLLKIKKSNNNINKEIEKIKSNMMNNIDYKKQLVSNIDIPINIKHITLEKIEEMSIVSNDYYKQLTFVKYILNFPWKSNDSNINFSDKEKCKTYLLNIEDKLKNLSYGHEEAKKELLQTIGKWVSNPDSQGTCFGLYGPPGVGKTLLAKTISKALDIPFAEITLGGQNDGELLYGHGYTYSGSQPGLIIKKMVEMGKSRCILYFDELDKACSRNGSINEITSILIHLTDPNMNKTFQDRFFQGIDFPMDKVIIIFSYNDPSLIDPILLDRLKQIYIEPYTTNDKIKIVKKFIIPELSKNIGIQEEQWININDDLIKFIIDNYTNEAGVRSIKRKIEKIFLTLNLDKILEKNIFENNNLECVTKDIITSILENPVNNEQIILSEPSVGVINGLYASSITGGLIQIQIFNNFSSNSIYDIKFTGKQGDIMKESIECSLTVALDYINNNIDKYELTKEYLDKIYKYGFHVHTPSTSTPKDGPSAGSAFTLAFISRILNKKIKNNIAITGEIDLVGKITKIGGLTFKLIGAKKAGINQVFIPLENKLEYLEIKNKNPELFYNDFEIILYDNIKNIIDLIII
jgi:ATP-dependent Lon protease